MKFKASLDRLTIAITVLVVVVFTIITYEVVLRGHDFSTNSLCIVAVMWMVFIVCYGLHPKAYELQDSSLNILCPFYSFSYAKKDIQRVRFADRTEMVATIRVFGVGGLFGYYGKFYNRTLGWMNWFATQRKNYIILETTGNDKIVLTPDNAEEFMTALKDYLAK